ncbi:hypothetical protein OC25_18990 [Pedobacter kyungheensis]|uniref:DUF6443 domain-containing protein n=1 Tax=Pedobacter kyungheensis TaxID=1069985 RepID=A0A0C1D4G1_9SPHI|nr:DUF6443 domain-containing protein [Pedobacter kyungheensis]KIA91881.1 hypothetical protein OC25_18990 [Pedobacter kyungheensis]
MLRYLYALLIGLCFANNWTYASTDYPRAFADTAKKITLNTTPTTAVGNIIKTIYRKKGASPYDESYLNTYDVSQQITYVDGLGRTIQAVSPMASPGLQDIVQPFKYDEFGRQPKQYLPYTAGNNGSYKADALTTGQGLFAFYNDVNQQRATTAYPYSTMVYDKSPFNTIKEQGAVGPYGQPADVSISGSGHTNKAVYSANAENEVALWAVSGGNLLTTANYPAGKLRKTISKDPNWVSGKAGTVESFTDLQGKLVLKRTFETETISQSTYYVYNLLGQLSFVLPPNVSTTSMAINGTDYNDKVYAYKYDQRGRVIEKKLPGIGLQLIIYNELDQPVLTQDAGQRAVQKWMYIKYDAMGRVVITGTYATTSTEAALRSAVQANTSLWESRNNSSASGYSSVSFPVGDGDEIFGINFYDDYNLPVDCPFSAFPSNASKIASNGMLTARKIKRLGTSTFLWAVNYYDQDKRLLESYAQNQLNGYDHTESTYTVSGILIAAKRTHIANSVTTIIAERYDYDHMGRLMNSWSKINTQPEVLVAAYQYNELGQVVKKQLHSIDLGNHFLQVLNYQYNINGLLKSINDINISSAGNTKFGMQFLYEDAPIPQYNGNIGQSKWKVARTVSSPQLGYDFSYDKINRLSAAESLTGNTKDNNYGEYARYDEMGNIKSLGRYALIGGSNVREQIDSLSYQYTGGKLTTVEDNSSGSTTAVKALGFDDHAPAASTPDYTYNDNGYVVQDNNKGISNVIYNLLNLTQSLTLTGGKTLAYSYTADGAKLQKTFTDGSTISNTFYLGGIQYSGSGSNTPSLDFIQSGEGRMINNGGTFIYQYDLTDNLGNVRATIDADPADVTQQTARVIQENSFYAFGMVMPNAALNYVSGTKNNYLYNGKELQDALGVYDYGARMYDPAIGRWNGFDPMAERHFEQGAYNYVLNNPVRLMDLLGLTDYDPTKMTNDDWKKFDPKKDKFILNEVNISPGRNYDKEWAERIAKRNERDKAFMELLGSFSGSNNGETGSYNWSKDPNVLANVNAYEAYASLVVASGGTANLEDSDNAANGRSSVGNALVVFGVSFAAVENTIANKYWWLSAKGEYLSTKILQAGSAGKYIRGVQGYRNSLNGALGAAKGYRLAGNVIGGLGIAVTGLQYINGDITGTEAAVDAAFGVIGFFGPIGAGVSATYFLGKMGYEYFSGNTLFDKPK